MEWRTLRRTLDLLLDSKSNEPEVIFYGGEPLLQFDLIRRSVDHIEDLKRPNQEFEYSAITNGTLMGEAEADFLAGHDFDVQLSFDGVSAAQSLRGERTFEVLNRLLERLHLEHPTWFQKRFSVSSTVMPETVRYLADSVSYFLDMQVPSIGFSPGITDTSNWPLDQLQELVEQFERIFQISRHQYRRSGRIPVECLRDDDPRQLPQDHAMCNVERPEDLTIDADGKVYGCAMFAESLQAFPTHFLRSRLEPMRMGELDHPDLADRVAQYPAAVGKAKIFHHHEGKFSGYRECGDCEFLDHCFICPVSIGQIPGNTDPRRIPDFLCAFNLVSNRYRVKMAAEPGWLQWLKETAGNRDSVSRSERG